jgi:serine phosphatase RsbU (regulator of sigma subunit)
MRLGTDTLTCDHWIAMARANAAQPSGDCAQVAARPDGQTLFFLGDVAGHDARAAGFARELDVLVSDLARSSGPAALLTHLNLALEAAWPADVFVSAVCFSLDPLTGEGSIAVAGQLPPIVKGPSSSWPVSVRPGPTLGVVAEHDYEESALALLAGDFLVAVTDGITDPLGTGRDFLGVSALARLVNRARPEPADLCTSLLTAARGAGLCDDATVLAVASPLGATPPPGFISGASRWRTPFPSRAFCC